MEKAVNKNAEACCCKRTAKAKELDWLNSALLLQLEKKLLDMFDGQACFCRCENDADFAIAQCFLFDYDVSFCADVNLCPVAWGDGECGVHVYSVCVCVRGGRVASYTVRGMEPRQVFCRIMPCAGKSITR